jgi:hypothetical protein
MVERLTEDEMRRIQHFARTPAYAREPEQLLPEGADADQTGSDTEHAEDRRNAVPDAGGHR